MTKIRIILENDLGESIDVNSYELGSDFNKMYKLEAAISSVSGTILTDITAGVLALEEQSFLKKAIIKPTETIQ
jgi:trans-2-enoyl-CoA reductase